MKFLCSYCGNIFNRFFGRIFNRDGYATCPGCEEDAQRVCKCQMCGSKAPEDNMHNPNLCWDCAGKYTIQG